MADQTMRISNLPDSGSPERVAHDLYMRLCRQTPGTDWKVTLEEHLAVYQQCLRAAKGGVVDVSLIK